MAYLQLIVTRSSSENLQLSTVKARGKSRLPAVSNTRQSQFCAVLGGQSQCCGNYVQYLRKFGLEIKSNQFPRRDLRITCCTKTSRKEVLFISKNFCTVYTIKGKDDLYKILPITKSRTHYCTTMKQDKKLSFDTKLGAVKILHIVLHNLGITSLFQITKFNEIYNNASTAKYCRVGGEQQQHKLFKQLFARVSPLTQASRVRFLKAHLEDLGDRNRIRIHQSEERIRLRRLKCCID